VQPSVCPAPRAAAIVERRATANGKDRLYALLSVLDRIADRSVV
jgi:hypothetical protein